MEAEFAASFLILEEINREEWQYLFKWKINRVYNEISPFLLGASTDKSSPVLRQWRSIFDGKGFSASEITLLALDSRVKPHDNRSRQSRIPCCE